MRVTAFFAIVFLGLMICCTAFVPKPIYTTKEPTKKQPVNSSEESMKKQPANDEEDSSETPVSNKDDRAGISRIGGVLASTDREKMMSEIENLLGVPYRFGGTTIKGMDCSGFIDYVFQKALNMDLPRSTAELSQYGQEIKIDELQFGDLVFFNRIKSKDKAHVGIYLDSGQFAHASTSNGVMISSLEEEYFKERIYQARRVVY
jgi:cell wall-associated NlpC family hydrolase